METEEEKKYQKLALEKLNLLLILAGFLVVIIGFMLMTGKPTLDTAYNSDIFSFRRVVLAPGISLAGFIFIIFGILYKKKTKE